MKQTGENQEDKLQRLLDEREGSEKVEKVLNENVAIGNDLKLIKETDALLKSLKPEEPSPGFASRVMMHLDDVKISKAVNRQALLLLVGVLLCLFISGLLLNSVDSSQLELPGDFSLIGQDVKIEKVTQSFRPEFIMKGLMFISFFLAMLIFDRAILRPFFEKRKMA